MYITQIKRNMHKLLENAQQLQLHIKIQINF